MSTYNGQPLCGKFVDHERDECIIDLYAGVQALEASVDESRKATPTPAEKVHSAAILQAQVLSFYKTQENKLTPVLMNTYENSYSISLSKKDIMSTRLLPNKMISTRSKWRLLILRDNLMQRLSLIE